MKKENKRIFLMVCVSTLAICLIISIAFSRVGILSLPETNSSQLFTFFEGVHTTLYTPYLLKEFVAGNINFSTALGYHNVSRAESFLLILIICFGTYILFKHLKIDIPLLVVILGGILLGAVLSNEVEVIFSGRVANYIKMTHSFVVSSLGSSKENFLLVESSWVFSSADFLMALSVVSLFVTFSVFAIRDMWKTKQLFNLVFVSGLLFVLIFYSTVSTPPWVKEAQEHLTKVQGSQQEEVPGLGIYDFNGLKFEN